MIIDKRKPGEDRSREQSEAIKKNAMGHHQPLEQKLQEIRGEFSPGTFRRNQLCGYFEF